jgi:hypothetical protein
MPGSQVFEGQQLLTKSFDGCALNVFFVHQPFDQFVDELFARLSLAIFNFDPARGGYESEGANRFMSKAQLVSEGFYSLSECHFR